MTRKTTRSIRNCYRTKYPVKYYLLLLLFWLTVFLPVRLVGQPPRREIKAVRIHQPPVINGLPDEAEWWLARPADQFVQYEPVNGMPSAFSTEVRFLYDQNALYISAIMYDDQPALIPREMGFRDSPDLNADYLFIEINPFDDGLNAFAFGVSSSGVQVDMKLLDDEEDLSWSAVWKCDVAFRHDGWSAEIMIPYSALRFPRATSGRWGLNIIRSVRRTREISSWNFINKEIKSRLQQAGLLTGLENIRPPLHLALYPYVSGYIENNQENTWQYFMRYGMDLKYGITESFTLDMTLIPDFGQVRSDDEVYNLTPFEIYYEEKRPFFTEGTELFQRGNVFYSRRIGSTPEGFYSVTDSLSEGEEILENPTQTRVLNAAKLSGRSRKGLGIGLFNAITAPSFAIVTDTSENQRKILTQPATNYNMLIFDQNLPNNSYLSLYNTNVYYGKNHYTANVSGAQFQLSDRTSSYAVYGRFNLSQKYYPETNPEFGTHYHLKFSKTRGKFRFSYSYYVEDNRYDPNDLGYLQSNNDLSNRLELSYHIFNPVWKLLQMNNRLSVFHQRLYRPGKFSEFGLFAQNWITFTNHLSVGLNLYIKPIDEFDFYEARVPLQPFRIPPEWNGRIFISPDYRKPFIVDVGLNYGQNRQFNQYKYQLKVSPRLRINNHLSLRLESGLSANYNNRGFVRRINDSETPQIIFGRRNLLNVENVLQPIIIFSNRLALDLRLRHYWLNTSYLQFYQLDTDGNLQETSYNKTHDFSVNIFNADLLIRWEFAPGSELGFAWKNALQQYLPGEDHSNYVSNLKAIFHEPSRNSFSVRLLYYLDYQYLRNTFSRTPSARSHTDFPPFSSCFPEYSDPAN